MACTESVSIGLELCRRGLGPSGAENGCVVKSNLADAVFGRAVVCPFVAGGLLSLSLEGLVEAEMIEERLPAAECPARIVVPDDSLDTKESGRGMTSISSANRSCLSSDPVAGETGADSARGTFSGFRTRETSETEIAAERLCWWPFRLGTGPGVRDSAALVGLEESSSAPPSLPISSLAPLLCPPGREGIGLVPGLGGGLARPVLGEFPNENEGSSGDRAPSWIADTGRRAEVREYDVGAEVDGAGKVNSGSGRGGWLCAPPGGMGWAAEVMLAKAARGQRNALGLNRNHRISTQCGCCKIRGKAKMSFCRYRWRRSVGKGG